MHNSLHVHLTQMCALVIFQHIVKPENLYSHFDTPARITINVKDWTPDSHIYIVVTSYKYLRQGQTCQKDEEFDCSTTQSFLSSNTDHMCMSIKLACDGIPNCGQDYLPNMDENCFKVTIYSPCIYFRQTFNFDASSICQFST